MGSWCYWNLAEIDRLKKIRTNKIRNILRKMWWYRLRGLQRENEIIKMECQGDWGLNGHGEGDNSYSEENDSPLKSYLRPLEDQWSVGQTNFLLRSFPFPCSSLSSFLFSFPFSPIFPQISPSFCGGGGGLQSATHDATCWLTVHRCLFWIRLPWIASYTHAAAWSYNNLPG